MEKKKKTPAPKVEEKKLFCRKCGTKLVTRDEPAENHTGDRIIGIYDLHVESYPAFNKHTGEKNLVTIYYCPKMKRIEKNFWGNEKTVVDNSHDSYLYKKNF